MQKYFRGLQVRMGKRITTRCETTVNALETFFGVDLDRDGDIGEMGAESFTALLKTYENQMRGNQHDEESQTEQLGGSENTFATWSYMRDLASGNVRDASRAIKATNELFLIMSATGSAITYVYNRDMFAHNPLRDRLGYNNPCVGLDKAPALYVAAVLYMPISFINFQFVLISLQRWDAQKTKRMLVAGKLTEFAHRFFLVVFLLGNVSFILCFVIHPWEDVYGHTRPFSFYILSRVLAVHALYMEKRCLLNNNCDDVITKSHVVYLIILSVISLCLPIMFEINYWAYDASPGRKPLISPWIVGTLDYTWVFLTGFTNYLAPSFPIILGSNQHRRNPLLVRQSTIDQASEALGAKMSSHRRKGAMSQLLLHRLRSSGSVRRMVSRTYLTVPEAEIEETGQSAADLARIHRSVKAFVRMCEMGRMKGEHNHNWGWTVAIANGQLTIDDRIYANLHPDLQSGLFAQTGTYGVKVRIHCTDNGAVRFSLRLRIPDSLGLAVLPECAPDSKGPDYREIDLLLAENLKDFFSPTLDGVSATVELVTEPSISSVLTALKNGLIRIFRNRTHYVRTGIQPEVGAMGKAFYAGLPFKIGGSAMKVGLQPRQMQPLNNPDVPSKRDGDEGSAAETCFSNTRRFLAQNEAQWDLVLQVATDVSHSVAVGDATWDESLSPYLPVGTLKLPPQSLDPPSKPADKLVFNAWNMLAAHRPLGILQRARYYVYDKHSSSRLMCPFLSSENSAVYSDDESNDDAERQRLMNSKREKTGAAMHQQGSHCT